MQRSPIQPQPPLILSILFMSYGMNGFASGLFTVLPASLTTVRFLVTSKSVPSNVSRNSSITFSGPTGFSGFTEKGKLLAFGCKWSDGASRSNTRHSRRVVANSVRLSGLYAS